MMLNYCLKSRVRSLYISADSDAFVQVARSIAITSGVTMQEAEEAALKADLGGFEKNFSGIPIRFTYDSSPSLDSIESTIKAYDLVYGEFPELIVVDNLTNVRAGGDNDSDPFAGLEGLTDYLHGMARGTGAFVAALHHVTGPYNDADKPIPLSGVKNQVSRVPELVLTAHRSEDGYVGWSVVKNRGGRADPSGNLFATLEFDGNTMQVRDMPRGMAADFDIQIPEGVDDTERYLHEQVLQAS